MEKKKLPPLLKVKLMLTVEMGIFVLLFATLGVLFLAEIIRVQDWKRYAFTYVTLAGGVIILGDFIWCLASPKRRAKNSMLDKILVLPVGLALIGFDIYAITQNCSADLPYRYVIGANLCVIAAIYAFQAIFHWYRPTPAAMDAVREIEAEQEAAKAEPLSIVPKDAEEKEKED